MKMKIDNESGRAIAEAIDKRIVDVATRVFKTVPNDKSEIGMVVAINTANQKYEIQIKGKTYSAYAIKSALPLNINDQVLCLVVNGQYSQIYIIGAIAK